MTLIERIDNLVDEQRKQILIKTFQDMQNLLKEVKNGTDSVSC